MTSGGKLQCPTTTTAEPSSREDVDGSGWLQCDGLNWTVVSTWQAVTTAEAAESAESVVVIQHSFRRWGVLAFVSAMTSPSFPVVMRKPIGDLAGIVQPTYNLSADWFAKASASLADVPTQLARRYTADGEPDYKSIAAQLVSNI